MTATTTATITKALLGGALLAGLAGCQESQEGSTPDTTAIEAMLHEHTAALSTDEFGGRAPATPGETLTINYLQQQFMALGIGPGNGDSYLQEVQVTEMTAAPDAVLRMQSGAPANAGGSPDGGAASPAPEFAVSFAYLEDMVVGTQRQVASAGVSDSEVVFVGYGIVAPERNWNDYAGLDVAGKTVLILVNDPGYATQDPDMFNGNAMTYYGRWVYKYAEAARQGAAAALIVHETGPAGYGWDVVANSWSGPQISLTAANGNADRAAIEGWITLDAAEQLFAGAGLDYQEQKAAAAVAGFTAVPLGDIRASVSVSNTVRTSTTNNVIAAIPGSERPEESIIYTAHWDHLGTNPEMPGDNIYNGAADNASGTAALLALAALHAQEPAPARSVVFLAVTAEESGLLGSQWYAENPIFSIPQTVANINMDNMNTWGRTRDVVVVGYNSSELEHYLEAEAAAQGRYLAPEPTPERGYYYRSDHFNFARVGVPALYAESGEDNIQHGRAWGRQQAEDYVVNRYHAPGDEYDPEWDFSGAAEDVLLYFNIAQRLANGEEFPNWFEGNEFRAIRDESSASRAEQ